MPASNVPGGWNEHRKAARRLRHLLITVIAAITAVCLVAAAVLLWRLPARWRDEAAPPPGWDSALANLDSGKTEKGIAELGRVRRRWTHPVWDRRADFLSAYWSARLQLLQPALRHLDRMGRLQPPDAAAALLPGGRGFWLAPQAAALKASLLLRLNRPGEAAQILDPFARSFDRFAVGEDILETWALAKAASGRRAEALSRLDDLLLAGHFGSIERFHLLAGRIRQEGGDTAGAAEQFKRVFCSFPQSAASARALEMLDALQPSANGWTRADLPLLARRAALLNATADTHGVAETWAFARERIPGASGDREIDIHWAAALAADGQSDRALPYLSSVPSAPALAHEALLARARVELSRDRLAQARDLLRPLLSGPPGEWRREASLLLAEGADRLGKDAEALRFYDAGLALMDPSARADLAAWRAGWIAFKLGKYDGAIARFRRLDHADSHPGYKASGLYWTARAERARGRRGEADRLLKLTVERYRNDYYGIRAAAALGLGPAPSPGPSSHLRDPRAGASGLPVPTVSGSILADAFAPAASGAFLVGSVVTPTPRGDGEAARLPEPRDYPAPERLSVATGRELELLHLPGEAARAYGSAVRRKPSDESLNLRLADLALARGEREPAAAYLRAAYPQLLAMTSPALPRHHCEALYPLQGWEEIRATALRQSLDPYLICSVILQESGFNPLATSRAGALGLMQVLPDTARELSRQLGTGSLEKEKLFDPHLNILLGTAYLSDLLRRYGGRIEPSLAAYNAGTSRATRWWAESRGDAERFVEEIPFTETRLYIKRILSNHRMYHLLYGG